MSAFTPIKTSCKYTVVEAAWVWRLRPAGIRSVPRRCRWKSDSGCGSSAVRSVLDSAAGSAGRTAVHWERQHTEPLKPQFGKNCSCGTLKLHHAMTHHLWISVKHIILKTASVTHVKSINVKGKMLTLQWDWICQIIHRLRLQAPPPR